jgi:carboxymethylenebutenolidase
VADLTYPVPSGTLAGYLAVPSTPGPWPGVVVLHEVFGLTDDIRRQADRFADAGYLALAPDLFSWGNTARCLVATMRAMLVGRGRALDDVQAGRRFLTERADCTGRVGVIGFCMGGGLAVLVAPEGFGAAAPNYGDVPKNAAQRLEGACPMVASYGGKDRRLKGTAQRLELALTTLGVDNDVKEYPEAKHGFLFPHTGKAAMGEPLIVQFDPEAAADAWQRIFSFFDRHVKGTTT